MLTFDTLNRGLKKGLRVLITLAKIMIPIYIVTEILKYSGLLQMVARLFIPLMSLLGLPGEAAFALIIGGALNIYAALGVLASIDLTIKQATITGVVISISHNLIGESAVIKKIGINPFFITGLRIISSLLAGMLMNIIL
jgi:spore maturation protein SpmB